MEEAFDLADYLPDSFRTQDEHDYITFLWGTFRDNYKNGKYQFALFAYHMLMMSFIYFNIWQIKRTLPEDFKKSLIGFGRENERTLLKATSPFSFSAIGESAVLRFLKLIACDNSQIGTYTKLVKQRNDAAHANGNVFFSTQREVDKQIREILRVAEEIQTQSRPIICLCYKQFLLASQNPEDREFQLSEDQIREILIHENYMSRKDIEICANFDIFEFSHDNKEAIVDLHETLGETYRTMLEDRA